MQDSNHQGIVLAQSGRLQGAIQLFRQASLEQPQFAGVWSNLGNALRLTAQLDAAREALHQALKLQPEHFDARFNLAMLEMDASQLDAASAHLKVLQTMRPGHAGLSVQLAAVAQRLFQWEEAQAQHAHLWRACQNSVPLDESPLFIQAIFDDPALQASLARLYGWPRFQAARAGGVSWPVAQRRPGRLRIGYLSSDLFQHATLFLIHDALRAHDRARVEVFVYSHGAHADGLTQSLAQGVEHFVNLHGLSPQVQMARIREDALDVLIDLKGYTKDSAVHLLAGRLAPVQWHWLGYPGSLGVPEYVDGIVADRVLVPPGLRALYPEQVITLEGSYQPSARERLTGSASPDVQAPAGSILLGNFNQGYKHTQPVVQAWLQILQKVPQALLYLLNDLTPTAKKRLLDMAATQGVSAQRIRFLPKCDPANHLAHLSHMHLILDDFPYNGHTSTSDALWCGVPVLTMCGRSLASRVSASLLTALNMSALVTLDIAQYIQKAIELLQDPQQLQHWQHHLRDSRANSPLYDAGLFAGQLEAAALQAHQRYQRSGP